MRELGPWIERRRRTLARAAAEVARPAGTVPYLGRDLRLVPQPGRERVHRRGDELLVPKRDAAAAIERWYRRQARAEIGAAARRRHRPRRHELHGAHDPRAEDALGLVLDAAATCRSTGGCCSRPRRCWTTSSSTRSATSSCMDHSPRFWALLESRVPDWREHARWLRRYGPTLVL